MLPFGFPMGSFFSYVRIPTFLILLLLELYEKEITYIRDAVC